jgi:hypothetical protein
LLLVLAVVAAILLVPAPWNVVLVVSAAVIEGLEVWFFRWWTRELWRARSDQPVESGRRVVIRAVEPDLTLMVEPERH